MFDGAEATAATLERIWKCTFHLIGQQFLINFDPHLFVLLLLVQFLDASNFRHPYFVSLLSYALFCDSLLQRYVVFERFGLHVLGQLRHAEWRRCTAVRAHGASDGSIVPPLVSQQRKVGTLHANLLILMVQVKLQAVVAGEVTVDATYAEARLHVLLADAALTCHGWLVGWLVCV